jgi:hypothetical protein
MSEKPEVKVKAWMCEKVPESEYDHTPILDDGWVVVGRREGFVYIARVGLDGDPREEMEL